MFRSVLSTYLELHKRFWNSMAASSPKLTVVGVILIGFFCFVFYLSAELAFEPSLHFDELTYTEGILEQAIEGSGSRRRSENRWEIVVEDRWGKKHNFTLVNGRKFGREIQGYIGKPVVVYWRYWWLEPAPFPIIHLKEVAQQIADEEGYVVGYTQIGYESMRRQTQRYGAFTFAVCLIIMLLYEVSVRIWSKRISPAKSST